MQLKEKEELREKNKLLCCFASAVPTRHEKLVGDNPCDVEEISKPSTSRALYKRKVISDKLVMASDRTRTSNQNEVMVIRAASEALRCDKETIVLK